MIEIITESDFILPILEPTPPRGVQSAVGANDIENPLVFRLYYKGGQVENTIYLDDKYIDPLDLSLEVSNLSNKIIDFIPLPKNGKIGQKETNFYIQLDKKINLDLEKFDIAENDIWKIGANNSSTDYIYIYFVRKQTELVLNPKDKLVLTLKNFTIRNPTLSPTNVTMYYGKHSNLLQVDQSKLNKEISFPKGVTVMAPLSPYKINIPLAGRFVGYNTILNDGNTANNLTLKIFNRPLFAQNSPALLLDPAKSKFIISLETGDNSEALTTSTDANGVTITAKEANKWQVQKTSNQALWTVTPKASQQLASSIGFDLDISGLKTNKTSGVSYLYIDYENIGDYPDGRLVVPIEKTPLLYRDQQVGIGTNNPEAKLHIGKVTESQVGLKVEGPPAKTDTTTKEILRFVRPSVQNQANEDRVSFKLGKFEGKTDGKPQLDIALNDLLPVMSLRGDGNVGIGTTAPSARLHVSGGSAIFSDKVGIGMATNPDEKLHVSGKAIISEKLAIRTTNPLIDLAIGDNDTGLNQEGDGKLAIYTNSEERVRIDQNGNLGIGTTTPSAKLDVNGSVKLGDGSSIWKRIIFGKVFRTHSFEEGHTVRFVGQGISHVTTRTHSAGEFDVYFEKRIEPERSVLIVMADPVNIYTPLVATAGHASNEYFRVWLKDPSKPYTKVDGGFHFMVFELGDGILSLPVQLIG